MTVLMIEHDMGIVMDISDRLRDRITAARSPRGTPAEVAARSRRGRSLSRRPGGRRQDRGRIRRNCPTMTLPQVAEASRAETLGERLALREKERGLWRRNSWRQYYETRRSVAIGLLRSASAPAIASPSPARIRPNGSTPISPPR